MNYINFLVLAELLHSCLSCLFPFHYYFSIFAYDTLLSFFLFLQIYTKCPNVPYVLRNLDHEFSFMDPIESCLVTVFIYKN